MQPSDRSSWWKRRSSKGKAGIIVAALILGFLAGQALTEPDSTRAPSGPAAQEGESSLAAPATDVATSASTTTGETTGTSLTSATVEVGAGVIDGDTFDLPNGETVRLVQIDAPEVNGSECYATKSAVLLARLLPPGTRVRLQADPRLDKVDRFGRLLRYVFKGKTNINLLLVQRGAASPWFFDGDEGRYADTLLAAARHAKAARRGLWRACTRTKLDPARALATRKLAPEEFFSPRKPQPNCDPSYKGACVPPYPPDVCFRYAACIRSARRLPSCATFRECVKRVW